MADIKITSVLTSDLLALQKAVAVYGKKGEDARQDKVERSDEAVRIDVDSRIERLSQASPPTELPPGDPAITEQAARQLAVDVGQNLKDSSLTFASRSEKTILGLFG